MLTAQKNGYRRQPAGCAKTKFETIAQVYGFMALSAVYESVAAPHNWTSHRHYPCEAWSSKTNWLVLFEEGGGGRTLFPESH